MVFEDQNMLLFHTSHEHKEKEEEPVI